MLYLKLLRHSLEIQQRSDVQLSERLISRHKGETIKGPPKPLNTIVLCCTGAPQLDPIMPVGRQSLGTPVSPAWLRRTGLLAERAKCYSETSFGQQSASCLSTQQCISRAFNWTYCVILLIIILYCIYIKKIFICIQSIIFYS